MKGKANAPATAEERRHMAVLVEMGCLVRKGCAGRATIHHVSSDGLKRIARSHKRVVCLCEKHHQIQHGPHESVEALGHGGFEAVYGINLLHEAVRLWDERK